MKSVKVTVVQQDDPYHFRSTNEQGHAVDTDNSGAYDSGIGSGVSPMELLIIARLLFRDRYC